MRWWATLAAGSLVAIVGAQKPLGSPRPWQIAPEMPRALKQALNAYGRIRYSGTRVVEGKSGPDRRRHTELVTTDGTRTRIEFPADSPLAGQVVVETATERRQVFLARKEIHVLPPRREEAFGRIAQMVARRNIRVSETPGGNVAGLPTELVTITDRPGNVLQKLWIEPGSGMILRRELYDRTGAMTGAFEFTQINLHPIINPSDFSTPQGMKIITPETVLTRLVTKGGFKPVRLPPDSPYKLEGSRIQKLAQQEVLVQQYAGNGHRLTLYQLKTAVDPNRLGALERPDLQILAWQAGGSSFVLVGDLSDAELKDLGRRLGA